MPSQTHKPPSLNTLTPSSQIFQSGDPEAARACLFQGSEAKRKEKNGQGTEDGEK